MELRFNLHIKKILKFEIMNYLKKKKRKYVVLQNKTLAITGSLLFIQTVQ